MSSRTSTRPALPAGEQAASDEPAGSRRRIGLARDTPMVRALQVSVGVALLGLWQLAAAAKWPDPVLAKSPVQSWDYLAGTARSGVLWSSTRSTMTAVLIAWAMSHRRGWPGEAPGTGGVREARAPAGTRRTRPPPGVRPAIPWSGQGPGPA